MTLRDNIIYMLEKNRGSFVSGQDIALSFDVSRSAVAKAVSALKQEGFKITSVNNLGHKLEEDCDKISEYGIRAYLNDSPESITVYSETDSTNSQAKRAVAAGLNGEAVFIADKQTGGRGRQGKSFYSPMGTGLYFTAVLRPKVNLSDAVAITAAAAVTVCEILKRETKKDPKIKWVNDIFIDNKKVCGILTEAVADFESGGVDAVIIGIGINLTTEEFPNDINGIAASVGKINRNRLAAELFDGLKHYCDRLPCRDFMEDYRKHSLVLGKTVTFTRNGKAYSALAESISDDGRLHVVTEDNERIELNSGEISVKLF